MGQSVSRGIVAAMFACACLGAAAATHEELAAQLAKLFPPGTVTDEQFVRSSVFEVRTLKYRELTKDLQLTDFRACGCARLHRWYSFACRRYRSRRPDRWNRNC